MALYGCEAYLPATPVLCCLQTHITTPAQEATARCLLGGSNSLMRSEDTLFTHTQSLSLSGPLLQTSVSWDYSSGGSGGTRTSRWRLTDFSPAAEHSMLQSGEMEQQ